MRRKNYSDLHQNASKKGSFLTNTVAGVSLFTLAAVGTTGCASFNKTMAELPDQAGNLAATAVSPVDDVLNATGVYKGLAAVGNIPIYLHQASGGELKIADRHARDVDLQMPVGQDVGFQVEPQTAAEARLQQKIPLVTSQDDIRSVVLDADRSSIEEGHYVLKVKTQDNRNIYVIYDRVEHDVLRTQVNETSKDGTLNRQSTGFLIKERRGKVTLSGSMDCEILDASGNPKDESYMPLIPNKAGRVSILKTWGAIGFEKIKDFNRAIKDFAKMKKNEQKIKQGQDADSSGTRGFDKYMDQPSKKETLLKKYQQRRSGPQ